MHLQTHTHTALLILTAFDNCVTIENGTITNVCKNNATCEDDINRYTCFCTSEYQGTNCTQPGIATELCLILKL